MAEQGSLAVLGADSPSSAELYTPKRSVSRPGITKHVRTIGAEIRNLNEPVRRLIISKVVLKNFKSYGGTTVIGPFHKRFTAIVGPNGSGKSNVIDAMLFVFGFRAKQMRFDKLSELIHNSNAYIQLNKGRPLESMEVAIHFCEILDRDPDVDEFEVIPGSELVISREVNRDNSSKYRINGSPASQKQVSNALKAFGMDLYNNRFLILQGEVEQISQMKPKATKPDEEGLLEYLEDIIGTNQYLEKIKEAQLQCEELQDQYRERGNLTRVFQKEVEDLLESKQECDTYLLKEKDLLYNKVLISKLEIATAKHSREAMTAKLEMLENEYQESTAHFGAVEKDRDEALKGVKEIESELDSSLKSQKRLSESLQKMITRDEDLRKQLLREVKKVEEKTAGIKKATSNRPRHEAESKEKIRRSEEMLKAIPSLQDELEKAEKAFEELTVKMKPELSAANMELAKHEAMLAPLQQSYDKVNKDVNVLESSIELLNTNRKDIETEVESMRTRETKLEESIQQNKAKLKKQEETMKKQSGEFESNAKKAKELDATVRSRSQVYLKKKGEYESLKREFNESTGSKEQYRHVMGLVSSGKIRGVHGRLGDLGSIDPKYEKAFMAAAGGQVDVLIVDTPDVASQIFDELRRQNMGRSSAMALSVLNNDLKHHMDAFERAKHEGLPEGVQYLLNLTEPIRPMYKICFYYALRDTLLAENLNDATRVGYKHRRRVVTLDGEVIEPDGRMSGGGVQSKKGSGINTKRMDIPSKGPLDMKQLEALRKEIETEGHELEKLKGELVMLNQSQTLIGKEMGELKYSIDLLRQTVANEEIQLSELSQSAKNLVGSSQLGEIENKLKLLQEHLVEKKKEQSAAASKVKAQEKIVAAAYKDVDNVGKGQLKIAKDRVSEIERKLSDTRGVIERLRKEAANLQADSEKCARDVSKLTKEIEQHKSKEQQLEQQLNLLEEEAAVVSNDMNEVNEKVEQQKAKLKELRTVVTEKTKILNEHEMKAVDMKHNIEGLSKKLKQAEERDGVHRARLKDSIEQYKKTCKMIRSSQESQKLLNSVSDRKGSILIIEDDEETMPQAGTEEVDTRKEPEEDLEMLPEEELQKLDMERLTSQLDKLKNNMGPTPNLAVLDQFRLKVEEYNHKRKELLSLQNSLETAKRSFEQLCLKRKSEFLTNFAIIASKLKEIYQAITLGGDAELELVDSTDPFTEGILFSVRPAKKSWKQIQNLSGGEKTLSSLALVFALHHYKPNPVYFMDEIDAALDFRNVSIIAQSIKERTKDAQFIIISLRNQMFELCNQMVGIYKTMDVTKSVCINPASFDVRKRKPAEEDSTMTQEA